MKSLYIRPLSWTAAALAVYWSLLFIATHNSTLAYVDAPPYAHETFHFTGYAVLTLLAAVTVFGGGRWSPRSAAALLAVVIVFGALDEVMQMPIPARTAQMRDWACDAAGALAGLAVFRTTQRALEIRRAIRVAAEKPELERG
ncbi:MAG: VanZ family protein [Planctomycetes bacterium]|nr:VanZ family protein [Planctomycetota bacterium]